MNIDNFKDLAETIIDECYATIGDKNEYTKEEAVAIFNSLPEVLIRNIDIDMETLILLKGAIDNKMKKYVSRFTSSEAKVEGMIIAYTCSVLEATGKAPNGFGIKVLNRSNLVGMSRK